MSFKDLKIEMLDDENLADILKYYPLNKRGFITVGEKKWYLPYKFLEFGDEVYNFEPRPDDTWIFTYPRSGTTVSQELIWLVANDMNFDEAHRRHLLDRFRFLEYDINICIKLMRAKMKLRIALLYEDEVIVRRNVVNLLKNSIKLAREQLSPRFIKTHLPLDLLPKVENSECKIIYTARNPRDVVVSWYHFQKDNESLGYKGDFEKFCNLYLSNHVVYSPYWDHVKEGWAKRHRPNTLFIFYEDLIKDLPGTIRKVAAFYGKSYSEEQIVKLANHLNIEKFRSNKMVNIPLADKNKKSGLIRQGVVGGWKEYFTPEIEAKFNEWIADNTKDTDMIFPC